ncbi:MAG: hypothetical protein JSS64_03165 [Bacteroidetes bacterium]|nr:hypothetical protein [Bacteroidota bacterium]
MQEANFKSKLLYFFYQKCIIWYYKYKVEEGCFIIFLDEGLRAKEEADYVERITSLPEIYTKEKFTQKLNVFGTLTFTYDIKSEKTPEEINLSGIQAAKRDRNHFRCLQELPQSRPVVHAKPIHA